MSEPPCPPSTLTENWSPSGVALVVSQCRRWLWREKPLEEWREEGQNPGYTHGIGYPAPLGQHLTRMFLKETVASATTLNSAGLSHEVGTEWAEWATGAVLGAAVR